MFVRLICLMLLLVLPQAAPNALAADSGMTLDPSVGLNAYAALVDQAFERTRSELRIVAASENASSGNWDRMRGLLAALEKSEPALAAVWFARPDGSYLTADAGPTGQNLKDRAYFPALMAGKEIVGFLVVSKSTGKRSAVMAVPVQAGGRVIGALGVSLDMEKLATQVEGQLALPNNVTFYALDPLGQIALHRQSTLLFEFATKLGSSTLTQAVSQMLAKPQGMVRYDFQGVRRTAIFKRSAVTGWVYALRW
jgi:C4-dicarboxylate-specific signal transduction histidine kinase